jgi:hypothetical protein
MLDWPIHLLKMAVVVINGIYHVIQCILLSETTCQRVISSTHIEMLIWIINWIIQKWNFTTGHPVISLLHLVGTAASNWILE